MSLIKRNGSLFPRLLLNDFFDNNALTIPSMFDLDDTFQRLGFATKVPSVNITESNEEYSIQLAAPGLEKKDFKIEVENDMLTISSHKEQETNEEKGNYRRREFSYKSFSRSFQLPQNSQTDKIDAHYQDGILKLTLPKKEVSLPAPKKEISVN
ncbi:Hsp20/alpha crystallin family protein [Dyadobacter psychrotolerans]|uniref:Hsp20/alpha crystallin family protein n=1 Tax=Dyadobacter psychrotolerans TaxID=2541721 RepID=A0A4R5DTY1_9BACT|nr:Hsp20/alpha crystallin family protein [Dyadobacter psychrotolerans]TDE17996.1 Hsp20/alpha crystallin family protein [Dyadobacter psychrotolerans]